MALKKKKLWTDFIKIAESEENKLKKWKKSNESLCELWDNIKRSSLWIIGVPEGEEREKGAGSLFKQ